MRGWLYMEKPDHPPRPPLHKGILEVALYAEDLDAAADFWSRVIGLTEISRKAGRHVFFHAGQQILLIFDPRATEVPLMAGSPLPVPPHGSRGAGHICLAAPAQELDGWRAHLERMGVEIEADFIWLQGGRSLYFRDPAGNSIEIADPAIWPVAQPKI